MEENTEAYGKIQQRLIKSCIFFSERTSCLVIVTLGFFRRVAVNPISVVLCNHNLGNLLTLSVARITFLLARRYVLTSLSQESLPPFFIITDPNISDDKTAVLVANG